MKTFSFLANWRAILLLLLGFTAFILLIGESDDMRTLLLTKLFGSMLALVVFLLSRYWNRKKKIEEIKDLFDCN